MLHRAAQWLFVAAGIALLAACVRQPGEPLAARQAEAQVMRGEPLGLLHGLPLGVKDLQNTAGLLTTYVVPSESGPHRKYYSLNAAGRDQLTRSGKLWRSFAATMDGLLDDDRGMAA